MSQIEDLTTRRAELELEVALLQRKIEVNALDQAEVRKLDAATAALAQVEKTLASTREGLARKEAREAYTVLLAEQRAKAKRQRELATEIFRQQAVIAGAWRVVRPLISEHESITAGSRAMIERLYKLAEQAGNGLDPMKDIDADSGAALDTGFIRLIGR